MPIRSCRGWSGTISRATSLGRRGSACARSSSAPESSGPTRSSGHGRGPTGSSPLIEIARIRRSLDRYAGFRDRCFTPAEQAYCDSRPNPAESYAGRFAGKEAVGKALGFGVARAFAWKEIEIVGRPKPSVKLYGRLAVAAERTGVGGIDLSMTHSRELAQAVAVATDA